MAKLSPAQEQAATLARLVYSESELTSKGEALRTRLEAKAYELEAEDTAYYWEEDWDAILKAFRRTEGAVRQLNLQRQMEEETILDDEELENYFQETPWELTHVGEWLQFELRVWSFPAWEGQLAFGLARDEEETATAVTTLA